MESTSLGSPVRFDTLDDWSAPGSSERHLLTKQKKILVFDSIILIETGARGSGSRHG